MSSHYISGRNGIEYLAKSLAHSRKGTTQITATQSIDRRSPACGERCVLNFKGVRPS